MACDFDDDVGDDDDASEGVFEADLQDLYAAFERIEAKHAELVETLRGHIEALNEKIRQLRRVHDAKVKLLKKTVAKLPSC